MHHTEWFCWVGDITVVITIPVATQMYKTSFVYHNKGGGQAEREGIWKSSTLQWTCALHTGTTLISEIHRSYNFRTSGEMDRVHVAVNHATDMRRCVYLRGQVSRQVGPPIVGIIAEKLQFLLCHISLTSREACLWQASLFRCAGTGTSAPVVQRQDFCSNGRPSKWWQGAMTVVHQQLCLPSLLLISLNFSLPQPLTITLVPLLLANLICLPQELASGKRHSVLLVLPCGGLFQRTLDLVHTLELFRDFVRLFLWTVFLTNY